MRRRVHEPEWTLQAIRKGHIYGALYEAYSEEDARETAAGFLSFKEVPYQEVVIYRFGAIWDTIRGGES